MGFEQIFKLGDSNPDSCIQGIYSVPAGFLAAAVQFFQNFLQGLKIVVGDSYDFWSWGNKQDFGRI